MFETYLRALEYPDLEVFDLSKNLQSLVIWLQEKKIKIKTEIKLNDQNNFESNFDVYLNLLEIPKKLSTEVEKVRWLLSYAIQHQFHNNRDQYNIVKQNTLPKVVAKNALDNLNFQSEEFKTGVQKIAHILGVVAYDDSITLRACKKLVVSRLSTNVQQNEKDYIKTGTLYPFSEIEPGSTLSDPVLADAAKILRLCYICDLRELQTTINEIIVGVQNITANPKTDTKLGKVGV